MTKQPSTQPRTLALAVGLTILAGSLLASSDAVGKMLSMRTNIWQAAWARYAFHTLFIIGILVYRSDTPFPKTRRPALQLLRGSLLLTTTILMYAAIMRMPLANATTIQFLAPILVVIWAALFLREFTGPGHWFAIAGGFCGTIIVVGPDMARLLKPEVFLPLGVAICLSAYLVLTRVLSTKEERGFTEIATTGVGTIALTLALPLFWVPPDLHDVLLMVLIGGIAALGHTSLVTAFSRAPVTTLTPFLYSQVLSAALITILWFGEDLTLRLILGATILVGSGILLWRQEHRTNQAAFATNTPNKIRMKKNV